MPNNTFKNIQAFRPCQILIGISFLNVYRYGCLQYLKQTRIHTLQEGVTYLQQICGETEREYSTNKFCQYIKEKGLQMFFEQVQHDLNGVTSFKHQEIHSVLVTNDSGG